MVGEIQKGGGITTSKQNSRIAVFDYLRGFLMLCIVINHLFLFPSVWGYITGQGILWVSAAEGFFFVSGLMLGMVRGGEYKLTNSLRSVAKKIASRAWQLYLVNFVIVVICVLSAHDILQANALAPIKSGYPGVGSYISLVWGIATFQITYGWADFLPYYVVFLLLAIPALWLLKRQLWYFVLALAVLGWFEPRIIDYGNLTYFFVWQIYFFVGLVVGYQYRNIQGWYVALAKRTRSKIEYGVISVFVATLVLNWAILFALKPAGLKTLTIIPLVTAHLVRLNTVLDPLLNNGRMGVLRVAMFGIWALGLYFVFVKCESYIRKYLDWLLGVFGRQTLRIYILSSLLAFYTPLFVQTAGVVNNTLVAASLVILLVLLVRLKVVQKVVPN